MIAELKKNLNIPDSRNGGILMIVLICGTLLVSLVLSAAVHTRLRWAVADEVLRKSEARDLALSQIARVTAFLSATGGETVCAAEDWQEICASTETELYDEESRINLKSATPEILKALLQVAAGLAPEQAGRGSGVIIARREELGDSFVTPFQLSGLQGLPPSVPDLIAPHVTLHGSGRLNINTVDETVLRVLLVSAGAAVEERNSFIAGLRTARRQKVRCTGTDEISLANFFLGANSVPQPGHAKVISEIAPMLDVRSGTFRGTTAAPCRIDFVFERDKGCFAGWTE